MKNSILSKMFSYSFIKFSFNFKQFSDVGKRRRLHSVEKSFKTLNILAEKFDICSKQYKLIIVST